METLLFCTSWADSEDAWRLRYGRWVDAVRSSPLARAQILLADDGSPCSAPFEDVAQCQAEALPVERPNTEVVVARFAEHLGRRAICDYPGWWRSFGLAATYATRYGFDKIVHLESDTFLLSQRLHDHVNALDTGWVVFWCPRWQFPETCIQVICADQLPAFCQVAAQPYGPLVGHPVERLLPFTVVESNFKGDRYGEYRTEVPLDADYASQIAAYTTVWHGHPPPIRRMLALTHGPGVIPGHQALYPTDAWRHLPASASADAAMLDGALAKQPPASLDAIQLTLCQQYHALPLDAAVLQSRLSSGGELVIHFRDSRTTPEAAVRVAHGIAGAGFAPAGVGSVAAGGCWIVALSRGTLAARLAQDRLAHRLRLVCGGRSISATKSPMRPGT